MKLSAKQLAVLSVGVGVVAVTAICLGVFLNRDKGYCKASARLYFETDFKGDYEDYNSNYAATRRDCACYHYDAWARQTVKSVDTYGTCVRLFVHGFCKGQSLAVYPGSAMATNLRLGPAGVFSGMSVGCCVEEEFVNSTFRALLPPKLYKHYGNITWVFETGVAVNYTGTDYDGLNLTLTNDVSTNPGYLYFHDWFVSQISRTEELVKGHVVNAGQYLTYSRQYLVPKNGEKYFYRVEEIMQTEISLANFSNPQTPREISREILEYYETLEKNDGDTLGFFSPLEIGGPSNVTYNVFPMSFGAKTKMAKVITKIRNYLEETKRSVRLSLDISYKYEYSTRPLGYTYRIEDEKERDALISYGVVLNN